MKYVPLALGWVFGVLFGLAGVSSLAESPLGGICFIAISLLLLPPARKAIYSKTNIALTPKMRAISIFILFVAFGFFVEQSQTKKAEESPAHIAEQRAQQKIKEQQENAEYFNNNREEILASISAALAEKKYKAAISQSKKYLATNDAELTDMHNQAKNAFNEIIKNEILEKLKTVPASEFKENKDLYFQLTKLDPDNSKYQSKLEHYSKKLSEKQEKERQEKEKKEKEQEMRIAKFGEPPTQSAWDGSYYAVERYLKKVANDPDSIKMDGCTNVYQTESGWLVGCNYRGRNAFGGMIRQSNWFTIIHDQVIQMHDSDAYKQ
jgi:uncharacterized protein (UPF0297 family)